MTGKGGDGEKSENHQKRRDIGKRIVGIDPGKEKHQACVIDGEGISAGRSRLLHGQPYTTRGCGRAKGPWRIRSRDDLVCLVVETACNVWRTIEAEYVSSGLYRSPGESPTTTEIRQRNNDYRRLTPKDALLVAINARGGITSHRQYTPEINKLRRLALPTALAKDDRKP